MIDVPEREYQKLSGKAADERATSFEPIRSRLMSIGAPNTEQRPLSK